jgi:hypothetical protein
MFCDFRGRVHESPVMTTAEGIGQSVFIIDEIVKTGFDGIT